MPLSILRVYTVINFAVFVKLAPLFLSRYGSLTLIGIYHMLILVWHFVMLSFLWIEYICLVLLSTTLSFLQMFRCSFEIPCIDISREIQSYLRLHEGRNTASCLVCQQPIIIQINLWNEYVILKKWVCDLKNKFGSQSMLFLYCIILSITGHLFCVLQIRLLNFCMEEFFRLAEIRWVLGRFTSSLLI